LNTITKDNYLQTLRAFAIIAVVLIHSYTINLRNIPINITMEIISRQFINYAVPLFFFISGYFVSRGELASGWKPFVLKKIKRLMIPYFTWSVIGLFAMSNNFKIGYIVYALATGSAMYHLYFMVVLFQFVALTPFIIKGLGNKKTYYLDVLNYSPIFDRLIYLLFYKREFCRQWSKHIIYNLVYVLLLRNIIQEQR